MKLEEVIPEFEYGDDWYKEIQKWDRITLMIELTSARKNSDTWRKIAFEQLTKGQVQGD